MNIEKVKQKYYHLFETEKIKKEELQKVKEKIEQYNNQLSDLTDALQIAQTVGLATQHNIKEYLDEMVTYIIQSIFGNNYQFCTDFIIKRNKSECELSLIKDGMKLSLLNSTGGGLLDIIMFALRISLLIMKKDKKANVIILDEPFKWVSKEYISPVCDLLKKISFDLKIQFIIVTHIAELKEKADSIIEIGN